VIASRDQRVIHGHRDASRINDEVHKVELAFSKES
jgi:hypothetical protein